MAKFKYMGAADSRVFRAGEDFSGRLATPLPRDVVLGWGNRHVIDSEDEANDDLPDVFWELLAEEPGFQDVSDAPKVPLNDAERLWRGQRDPYDTRYASQGAGDGMPVFNKKTPLVLRPPMDQMLRPAGSEPNDDLPPDGELVTFGE